MMATAYDYFWSALTTQDLPATVPVADDHEREGIVTATFDVQQNAEVTKGVSAKSWRERATMAIYACHATRLGIDSEHSELHST